MRPQTRRLVWEACYNARDLGGYPTAYGTETRWGTIIRADTLSRLTEAGRAALVAYGVRTVLDLRGPQELAVDPNPFAQSGVHSVAYVHLPFIDPAAGPAPACTTLADDYIHMLTRFQARVAIIMTAIAQAPAGGVVVHCASGKDRTGLVAALLLELAGVPRETVCADYALSAEYLRPFYDAWLASEPAQRAERERRLMRNAPRMEVMQETLLHIDERHGGVEAYLRAGGMTADDTMRLRERLRG